MPNVAARETEFVQILRVLDEIDVSDGAGRRLGLALAADGRIRVLVADGVTRPRLGTFSADQVMTALDSLFETGAR